MWLLEAWRLEDKRRDFSFYPLVGGSCCFDGDTATSDQQQQILTWSQPATTKTIREEECDGPAPAARCGHSSGVNAAALLRTPARSIQSAASSCIDDEQPALLPPPLYSTSLR